MQPAFRRGSRHFVLRAAFNVVVDGRGMALCPPAQEHTGCSPTEIVSAIEKRHGNEPSTRLIDVEGMERRYGSPLEISTDRPVTITELVTILTKSPIWRVSRDVSRPVCGLARQDRDGRRVNVVVVRVFFLAGRGRRTLSGGQDRV